MARWRWLFTEPSATPSDAGDLGHGEVVVEAQHDALALAAREVLEPLDHGAAARAPRTAPCSADSVSTGGSGTVRRDRAQPAQAAAGEVHHRPAHVGERVVARTRPRLAQVRANASWTTSSASSRRSTRRRASPTRRAYSTVVDPSQRVLGWRVPSSIRGSTMSVGLASITPPDTWGDEPFTRLPAAAEPA